MRIPFFTPRATPAETKSTGLSTLFALATSGPAHWSQRSYASLAREGFMRNPVAYRAVRMIAEAAASVPWVVTDAGAEAPEHA